MRFEIQRPMFCAILLALLGVVPAAGEEHSPSGKRSPIKSALQAAPRRPVAVTISKPTTYITEPLRKDGYVDYVAALNRLARKDITPTNNAAVLFWKAMGPREVPRANRAKHFQMLGTPPVPERGNYFVLLDAYAEEAKHAEKPADAESTVFRHGAIQALIDPALKRPWPKKEFPLLACWLAVNEKPLTLLVEASKRPRWYEPMICGRQESVIVLLAPAINKYYRQYRQVAWAFVARAMLRAGGGKVDEAWEDLLACHRMARLAGQGPLMTDALAAAAMEGLACEGDEALLQHEHLSADRTTKMRNDLARLPVRVRMGDVIDTSERFLYLDRAAMVPREGITSLAKLGNERRRKGALDALTDAMAGTGVDWDLVLRKGNTWYDRLADACRRPAMDERNKALEIVYADMCKARDAAKDWKSFSFSVLANPRKALSERVSSSLLILLAPAIQAGIAADELATMKFDLIKCAFALASYHADHRSYPAKLADLTPTYLPQVPKDMFARPAAGSASSGIQLRYRREGDGFLLYSVGINGKDDGGKTYDDGNWCDDIVVRVPAAAKPK